MDHFYLEIPSQAGQKKSFKMAATGKKHNCRDGMFW
jgi:hypothetical protein